jgi:hypothetical protein
MGMSNPNTIDLIARDKETGKLLLVMTEHRPWDDEEVMHRDFHAKANAYAQFVLGDQFRSRYPQLTPGDVIVKLDCQHTPGENTQAFFERIRQGLHRYGLDFRYEVCGSGE